MLILFNKCFHFKSRSNLNVDIQSIVFISFVPLDIIVTLENNTKTFHRHTKTVI